MIAQWIIISASILIGSLVIAFAIIRLASSIENVARNMRDKTYPIGVPIYGRSESEAASHQPIEEAASSSRLDTTEMDRDLLRIQARAFDSPPIVASGDGGVEIDSGDDIRSSADRLSRNLSGETRR